MSEKVDYYISAVRLKGNHVTHVRAHKALTDRSFAPHGVVQPRSTVVINLRNNRSYRTLVKEQGQTKPGPPLQLVETGTKFYLRIADGAEAPPEQGDVVGDVPEF